MTTFYLPTSLATEHYGLEFASTLQAGSIVFLSGDLGAGKTSLVRGILQGLGHEGTVKSPTFTLVEPYSLDCEVYHFDLYRLEDPAEELEMIGMRDYLHPTAICLIEWPEKAAGYLPKPNWWLTLEIESDGRRLTVEES
jgi:tRNA threonylcarbamoyladenosine biosynthesis protein TsaE